MQHRVLEAQAPITHVYFSRIINKSHSTPINIIIKNIVHGTHVMQGASTECTKHSILEPSQPKWLHAEKINNREQSLNNMNSFFIWFGFPVPTIPWQNTLHNGGVCYSEKWIGLCRLCHTWFYKPTIAPVKTPSLLLRRLCLFLPLKEREEMW